MKLKRIFSTPFIIVSVKTENLSTQCDRHDGNTKKKVKSILCTSLESFSRSQKRMDGIYVRFRKNFPVHDDVADN